MSLVVPWLLMTELCKASHPDDPPLSTEWRRRPASNVIYTWWALLLAGQIVSLIGSAGVLNAMFSSIGDLAKGGDLVKVAEKLADNNLRWYVAATLLTGAANMVGALGIRSLVARQEHYATKWHLSSDTAAPAYFAGALSSTPYGAATPTFPYPGYAGGLPVTPAGPPPGWYPDPSGRHQHRWWDGASWTASVGDNGVAATDPV